MIDVQRITGLQRETTYNNDTYAPANSLLRFRNYGGSFNGTLAFIESWYYGGLYGYRSYLFDIANNGSHLYLQPPEDDYNPTENKIRHTTLSSQWSVISQTGVNTFTFPVDMQSFQWGTEADNDYFHVLDYENNMYYYTTGTPFYLDSPYIYGGSGVNLASASHTITNFYKTQGMLYLLYENVLGQFISQYSCGRNIALRTEISVTPITDFGVGNIRDLYVTNDFLFLLQENYYPETKISVFNISNGNISGAVFDKTIEFPEPDQYREMPDDFTFSPDLTKVFLLRNSATAARIDKYSITY